MTVLKWAVGLGLAFVALLFIVGANSKPDSVKARLQKAAKECYVTKAQNRMPDTECRSMENTANSM